MLLFALILVSGGAVVKDTIGFRYNILVVPLLAFFIARRSCTQGFTQYRSP